MKKVILLAVVSAIVTAIAAYIFLDRINNPAEIERTSVIVAAVDVEAKTELLPQMLKMTEIPTEAVHIDAVKNITDVVGMINAGPLVMDEPILSSKVYEKGDLKAGLAFNIEHDKRAYTVAVSAITGVAGFLQPGDKVDIVLIIAQEFEEEEDETLAPTPEPVIVDGEEEEEVEPETLEKYVSMMLYQNIKILAVGNVIDEGAPQPEGATYNHVTLSLTPQEVVELNLAENQGIVRLVLRSPLDDGIYDLEYELVETIGVFGEEQEE